MYCKPSIIGYGLETQVNEALYRPPHLLAVTFSDQDHHNTNIMRCSQLSHHPICRCVRM